MSLLDQHGRPIKIDRKAMGMVVNENAFHWTRYNAEVYYNPDNVPLLEYEKMYTTDETVFSGVEFLVMSAISKMGEYTNEDDEKETFIREQLANVPTGLPAKIAEIMTAVPYGFSLTEIIYQVANGKVGLADLQTLHPATIHLDLYRSGPNKNKPRVAYQFFRRDHQMEIPLTKAILYSHGATFGNAYGVSRLKHAYNCWFIKNLTLKNWAKCCERYGTPFIVGKTDSRGVITVNGQQKNNIDHFLNVLDSMVAGRGSTVINKDDAIDITYAASGYGENFEGLVAYCNKMIYRAIGLPSLIADHGKSGSYSLGQQHFRLFVLVMGRILFEVIDLLLDQLVRPLLEMNFGPQTDLGDFSVDEFEQEVARTAAETAEILTRNGYMDARSLPDANYVRERQGLPLWEEEDIQSSVPPAITGLDPEQSTSESIAESTSETREARNFSWQSRIKTARQRRYSPKELQRLETGLKTFIDRE